RAIITTESWTGQKEDNPRIMRLVLTLVGALLWSLVGAADYYNGFVYEENGFQSDLASYDGGQVAAPMLSSLEMQQVDDFGAHGQENRRSSRVVRDVRHQAAYGGHGRISRSSPLDGGDIKYDDEQIDLSQQDDSLYAHYEGDSHEEPVEERIHGVRAREPRDGGGADEENDYRKGKVVRKRNIRHTAQEYENAIQVAIDEFNAEKAQERVLKETEKREIIAALTNDDHGDFTKSKLDKAIEDAIDEYYAQNRNGRQEPRHTADIETEIAYERAIQEAIHEYNSRQNNMIAEAQPNGGTKVKRYVEELTIQKDDPEKWSYTFSPFHH
ncbi:unnamed protein product, partial [Meganyctiphanes norvegica]